MIDVSTAETCSRSRSRFTSLFSGDSAESTSLFSGDSAESTSLFIARNLTVSRHGSDEGDQVEGGMDEHPGVDAVRPLADPAQDQAEDDDDRKREHEPVREAEQDPG